MAAIPVKTKKGPVDMTVDEHPKPQATPEGLAKLPPVFKKNGTVTAATASVSSDCSYFSVSKFTYDLFVMLG